MSKPWVFISPSSRGIGQAVTRHLLRNTTLPILATIRGSDTGAAKSKFLDTLENNKDKQEVESRLHVLQLDVTDEASIQSASEHAAKLFSTKTHHLHLGLAMPGILHPEKSPKQVEYAGALDTFKVNTLGPLMLLKWFGEFLPRKGTDMSAAANILPGSPQHATFLIMSARVGSTTDNKLGGWYSYRASKAGVISLAKTYDNHLRVRSGDNAMAMAYHPGTVKTEFSREFWGNVKEGKLFSVEFAAEKLVEVVGGRNVQSDRGRCWDWKGEEVKP